MDSKAVPTLRQRSFHLTRQRRLVLDILNEHPGHLDASMIFREAKMRDERISLATVYRSLTLLKEAGLIEENRLGEDHGHFEAIQESQHYHFACIRCGRVIEFESPAVDEVAQALRQQHGLLITEMQLHLRGVCPDCQDRPTLA